MFECDIFLIDIKHGTPTVEFLDPPLALICILFTGACIAPRCMHVKYKLWRLYSMLAQST